MNITMTGCVKMSFMKAVSWMKEGKKVRRSDWLTQSYIHKQLSVDEELIYHEFSTHQITYISSIRDFEATDWEIVNDDKEWNLAEQEILTHQDVEEDLVVAFKDNDVVKCRDLIIKDCLNLYNDGSLNGAVVKVVRKRFGELK